MRPLQQSLYVRQLLPAGAQAQYPSLHVPLQHGLSCWQWLPGEKQFVVQAPALFARPKHANAMPAMPMPNFFSAARRRLASLRLTRRTVHSAPG